MDAQNEQPPAAPEEKVATIDTTSTPTLASDSLAAMDRLLADPEKLIQGLRYLQQRIPDYIVLPVSERRALTNAANLDPELVEIGVQAAAAWPSAPRYLGRTSEELRQEAEMIRRWEEVERELRALTKGVAHANLARKHSLGTAILRLYGVLGATIRGSADSYLRPFYEDMKRVYLKTRGKSREKKEE